MSLKTYSVFYYGHDITDENQFINFSEDGGLTQISAPIDIGSYTITTFVAKVLNAMNEYGGQEYSATLDRATRKITITAPSNFDLLVTTGTQSEISAFALMGFTSDKSGSNAFESDVGSGFAYYPQYWLQSFVDFIDHIKSASSKVNTSASGVVEVVSYGQNEFMECNIKYITDITGQGVIKNNATGVADLRAFMNYAITKKPLEIMFDVDSPNVYESCILEKTNVSGSGTGFKLFEMYAQGLANYYETKNLMFRKIEG